MTWNCRSLLDIHIPQTKTHCLFIFFLYTLYKTVVRNHIHSFISNSVDLTGLKQPLDIEQVIHTHYSSKSGIGLGVAWQEYAVHLLPLSQEAHQNRIPCFIVSPEEGTQLVFKTLWNDAHCSKCHLKWSCTIVKNCQAYFKRSELFDWMREILISLDPTLDLFHNIKML
jgi:hypothetical protein